MNGLTWANIFCVFGKKIGATLARKDET